jgi:Tfp pilus assembly protein PilN
MALRDINLVPAPELENRLLRRHLLFWSGWLVASVMLIACLYLVQVYTIQIQKRSLTQMGDINLSLNSKVENIQRLQADQEKLNQQKIVTDTITKKNQSYSLVLFKLSHIMNENTWLSQLIIDGSKEKESADRRLLLTGFSLSNEYLGDFLNRLSKDPLFKNVALKYAREEEKENTKKQMNRPAHLIQFQIECGLAKG